MWTYAQMESALAQLYGADEQAQAGPFRGRLKHFQRLGIPLGERPGRGAKVKYDYPQIFQLMFCFEMSSFGVDPVLTVQLLEKHWHNDDDPREEIYYNLKEALDEVIEDEGDHSDKYFLVHPNIIEMSWDKSNLGGFGTRRWFRREQSDLVIRNIFGNQHRALIINFSAVVKKLRNALEKS